MSVLTDNIQSSEIQFAKNTWGVSKIAQTTSVIENNSTEKQKQLFRMNSFNNETTQMSSDFLNGTSDSSSSDFEAMDDSFSEDDDVEVVPVTSGRRRMALADIFENVNDNEMVTLLSLYVRHEIAKVLQRKWFCRRGGKSNVLEDLSCDEINAIRECACAQNSDTDSDVTCDVCQSSNSSDISSDVSDDVEDMTTSDISSELEKVTLRRRRGAKFDIFEGLTQSQKQHMLDIYREHIHTPDETAMSESDKDQTGETENEYRKNAQRRGGKFDIFEGLTDEERMNIVQTYVNSCCDDSTTTKTS